MNNKNILIFIGGIIVGGAAGVFGTRGILSKKYKKQVEEYKAEMEEYYQKRDEYVRVKHEEDQNDRKSNVLFPKEDVSRPGGRMTPEERASVKEKLQKNYEQTTNYAAMYKEKDDGIPGHIKSIVDDAILAAGLDEIDPAELEHPEEEAGTCSTCGHCDENFYCELIEETVKADETCSDWKPMEYNQNEIDEEQAFEEHQKNMNKPPKIISAEAYSNLPAHIDQQVLYFYSYDEELCDENDELIDYPGLLVGDALTKYDFANSDERCIFVMNYATDTCYEIQKVDASWADSH